MKPVVVFKGIKKFFPGTKALNWDPEDVLEVCPGEIHGLVGENGAGKSTLFQILMGFYGYDGGEITVFGNPHWRPKNSRDAERAGISIIMQQPNFAYNMTVAENIFMGHDAGFLNRLFLIDWKKQNEAAARLLEKYHFGHIRPTDIVNDLGFEERKQVEIVRALSANPKVLLVDETSAAISKESLNNLYTLLRSLRDQGTAIFYISHFIDEVYDLCDRISILRDGKLVARMMVKDTTPDIIIKNMVGRDISGNNYRGDDTASVGDVLLEVKNYSNGADFEEINLTVRCGEIVGIVGIGGCGSEIFGKAIFGYEKITSGELFYKGKKIKIDSPIAAIKKKIGFIPKDRDKEGLFLLYDLILNISAANMSQISKNNIVNHKLEHQVAVVSMKQYQIKAPSEYATIGSLSGGNRQKVAIAKWVANDSDLLIVNAPTRGIDVGAKYEIYRILEALKNKGKGILLISDELPELVGMCDRIYCFRKGRNVGEFFRQDGFTEEKLMEKMM